MPINVMLFILKIYIILDILLDKLTPVPVPDKYRYNFDPYFEGYFFQITLYI